MKKLWFCLWVLNICFTIKGFFQLFFWLPQVAPFPTTDSVWKIYSKFITHRRMNAKFCTAINWILVIFKDQSIVFLVKERAFANADVFQKVYILNKTWKTPSLTLFPMVPLFVIIKIQEIKMVKNTA